MKKKKKVYGQLDYIKANRRGSREAEIENHGHPINYNRVQTSKKVYNRKRNKADFQKGLPYSYYLCLFLPIIHIKKSMMKRVLAIVLLCVLACSAVHAQSEKEVMVLIDTDMGKIKVKLYNETPQHRDNFLKNVNENLYQGLLFHRIIRQFMVQGGDINSRNAPLETHLGDGDPGYTVPAEIVYPQYFHKRGALCAARVGDDENPEKASSASQFYIVTGKHFTEMELDKIEKNEGKTLTPEQRHAYMHEGGTPHLDGGYTVFGEVVSGIKVVEKMQFVETNEEDRPLKNIKIKSMTITN
ncbi:cyclophilin family peptidyl-prolyl cis-trans isomerase [Parabacteroides sp. PFB2-10]|nr:cyclophilin family peptidyl-prolyl cis-trans isomerase [Parabacteroides sp. PFB2-10]